MLYVKNATHSYFISMILFDPFISIFAIFVIGLKLSVSNADRETGIWTKANELSWTLPYV